jgi:hypothetical protein
MGLVKGSQDRSLLSALVNAQAADRLSDGEIKRNSPVVFFRRYIDR